MGALCLSWVRRGCFVLKLFHPDSLSLSLKSQGVVHLLGARRCLSVCSFIMGWHQSSGTDLSRISLHHSMGNCYFFYLRGLNPLLKTLILNISLNWGIYILWMYGVFLAIRWSVTQEWKQQDHLLCFLKKTKVPTKDWLDIYLSSVSQISEARL